MVRILVVDDHRFIRESLKVIFEQDPNIQVVGSASDGYSAVEQVELLNPEVVIIDLEMPQMGGLDATQIIRRNFPTVKVLVFSSHDEQIYIDQALECGANGYLLKSSSHQELKQAVTHVSYGKSNFYSALNKKDQSLQLLKSEIDLYAVPEAPIHLAKNQDVSPQVYEIAAKADSSLDLPLLALPQVLWKQYVGFGLTLVILLGGVATVLSRQGGISPSQAIASAPESIKALPVAVMEVSPVNSMEISRNYVGEIAPTQKSDLSFERTGRVSQILVKAGDSVTAGQALAYLDEQDIKLQSQDLKAQKAQAVAQLQELKAGPRQETVLTAKARVSTIKEQYKLAVLKRDRRRELYQAGAVSLEEFNTASTEVQRLSATLEEVQSQVNELTIGTRPESISAQKAVIASIDAKIASLQLSQQKSILRAPYGGKISKRLIDEGTVVSPGQALIQLIGGEVEAKIGVPSAVAHTLTQGKIYSLQVGEVHYNAILRDLMPELDSKTLTQQAIFSVSGAQANEIPAKQVVRLNLTETVKSEGFWVPLSALSKGTRGLWSSFVLESAPSQTPSLSKDTYRLTKQDLEILSMESDRALVRGTLKPGDKIVASGVQRLVSGQIVSISDKNMHQE